MTEPTSPASVADGAPTRPFPRRVFSGIQPTGEITLGNYFGAVRQWVDVQHEPIECIYCVVDYHAITADYEPEQLRTRTLEMARDLLACGIDPQRSVLFLQSQVPEHLELAWVFSAVTAYGELSRMTQFKDKGERQSFVSVGLFSYPVLQAADILVHRATAVPVGNDQLQHLELARDIARRFNQRFGETFPDTQAILTRATKIMSPLDPTKKMSKSLGEKHYIGVFESEESIRRKIKTHVTDTGGARGEGALPPGVANLLLLLEVTAPADVVAQFRQAEREGRLMYRDLKEAVSEHLLALLRPLRERRQSLSLEEVRAALHDGAARARRSAREVLDEVRQRIGIASV